MLDSLVRVSRRVGWNADRLATDPEARPASPVQSRESVRQTRGSPCLRQSNSPGGPCGLEARGRPSAPGRLTAAVYNSVHRSARSPSHRQHLAATEAGRSALPAESAPGEARRDARTESREIPVPDSPEPHAELNSTGRICGSTRLPLDGFTYS